MTREEALVQLRLGPGINEDVSEEYNEAVNMAVEALQQQPSERTETHECDLEQIIKSTIKEYIDKDYDDVTEMLLALNKDLCERIRMERINGI